MKKLRLDIDRLFTYKSLPHLVRSRLAVSFHLFDHTPDLAYEEIAAMEYIGIVAVVAELAHEGKDRELVSKAPELDLLALAIIYD